MADTQAQLDALDAAIASGVQTVTFNGRTVTYHSMADLLRARSMLAARLGTSQTSRLAVTSKMGPADE